ncbi:MAG: hypothetical protein ACMUIA_09665 [bacterium]
MKKVLRALIPVFFFITFLFQTCCYGEVGLEHWRKVVENGFGDEKNDYAWSMASYRGKLFVGTLNLLGGAEIWSSFNGEPESWERVYKSFVFLNSGIRCLYADGDRALYAGTFNKFGAEILRTTDGSAWTRVVRRGFGKWQNDTIRCITRFGDYLYAGTGHNGAELYRSQDGFNWEYVNGDPSFTSTKVVDPMTGALITNNIMIGELAVFRNRLYAFTWTTDIGVLSRRFQYRSIFQRFNEPSFPEFFSRTPGAFEVWRSPDGLLWEKVVGKDDAYGNGMGFSLHDGENMANDVVTSVAVFNGHLYLGPENANGRTALWRTANGTQWEKVLDFWMMGEPFNFYIWRMFPFQNRLFLGTFNVGAVNIPGVTGGQVWVSESGEPGTFYKIIHNGFDGEFAWFSNMKIPKNYGIRSLAVHNNALYAGTATMLSMPVLKIEGQQLKFTIAGNDVGCEVWRVDRLALEEILSFCE